MERDVRAVWELAEFAAGRGVENHRPGVRLRHHARADGQSLPIRRERQSGVALADIGQRADVLRPGQIPDPHGLIAAARGQPRSVWTERHGRDEIGVPAERPCEMRSAGQKSQTITSPLVPLTATDRESGPVARRPSVPVRGRRAGPATHRLPGR